MVREGSDYLLLAGKAEGVTKGSQYAMYEKPNGLEDSKFLGTLTADEPNSATTTLRVSKPLFELQDKAWAFLVPTSDKESLYVQVFADSALKDIFKEIQEDPSFAPRKICVVPPVEVSSEPTTAVVDDSPRPASGNWFLTLLPRIVWRSANTTSEVHSRTQPKSNYHVRVAIEDNKVVFDDLGPASEYGLGRIPYTVAPTAEELRPVLIRLAHFYRHLQRKNSDEALRNKVFISCKRLKRKAEGLRCIATETGPDLNSNGEIEIACKDGDSETIYGFRITSYAKEYPLYCAFFYFDVSDYSISECFLILENDRSCRLTSSPAPLYQPPISAANMKPLPPGQSLTIGYGDGGSSPFQFVVREGMDVEVGFLKLFVTTHPADFSHIPQRSPFAQQSDRDIVTNAEAPAFEGGYSITVPVVLTRQK